VSLIEKNNVLIIFVSFLVSGISLIVSGMVRLDEEVSYLLVKEGEVADMKVSSILLTLIPTASKL
jgi:hypothetical protein